MMELREEKLYDKYGWKYTCTGKEAGRSGYFNYKREALS